MEPSSRPLIRLPARAACQLQGVIVRKTKKAVMGKGRAVAVQEWVLGSGGDMSVAQNQIQ